MTINAYIPQPNIFFSVNLWASATRLHVLRSHRLMNVFDWAPVKHGWGPGVNYTDPFCFKYPSLAAHQYNIQ